MRDYAQILNRGCKGRGGGRRTKEIIVPSMKTLFSVVLLILAPTTVAQQEITNVPSPIPTLDCRPWCAYHEAPWRDPDLSVNQKCRWAGTCDRCLECFTLSPSPPPSTEFACLAWCENHNAPWTHVDPTLIQKCRFKGHCDGCPQCSAPSVFQTENPAYYPTPGQILPNFSAVPAPPSPSDIPSRLATLTPSLGPTSSDPTNTGQTTTTITTTTTSSTLSKEPAQGTTHFSTASSIVQSPGIRPTPNRTMETTVYISLQADGWMDDDTTNIFEATTEQFLTDHIIMGGGADEISMDQIEVNVLAQQVHTVDPNPDFARLEVLSNKYYQELVGDHRLEHNNRGQSSDSIPVLLVTLEVRGEGIRSSPYFPFGYAIRWSMRQSSDLFADALADASSFFDDINNHNNNNDEPMAIRPPIQFIASNDDTTGGGNHTTSVSTFYAIVALSLVGGLMGSAIGILIAGFVVFYRRKATASTSGRTVDRRQQELYLSQEQGSSMTASTASNTTFKI